MKQKTSKKKCTHNFCTAKKWFVQLSKVDKSKGREMQKKNYKNFIDRQFQKVTYFPPF